MWIKCLEETNDFPQCKKGKTYYAEKDSEGNIHVLDEFWLKLISINDFDVNENGCIIISTHKNKFEIMEDK